LFVITVAFEPGVLQDAAKMGALGSCLAALVAMIAARASGVRRVTNG
jgi:Na+:H+ antiporter, NhaA family